MDAREAQGYMRRWAAAEAVEIEELRAASVAQKLAHLAALVASRHLFPRERQDEEEERRVRQTWRRLRAALNE